MASKKLTERLTLIERGLTALLSSYMWHDSKRWYRLRSEWNDGIREVQESTHRIAEHLRIARAMLTAAHFGESDTQLILMDADGQVLYPGSFAKGYGTQYHHEDHVDDPLVSHDQLVQDEKDAREALAA